MSDKRPHRLSAVLFDFDGTLADTEPLSIYIDQREMARHWGIHPSFEELFCMVGTDGEEPIPELFARYGIEMDGHTYWQMRGGNEEIYHDMDLELFDGAYEFLETLQAAGLRMGIVSTTARDDIACVLERLDIADFFELCVCGDEAGAYKPHPAPYLRALELMGLSADEVVVVEDSPAGIASARAAGLYVVAYKGSIIEQDSSAAHEEVRSYHELKLV